MDTRSSGSFPALFADNAALLEACRAGDARAWSEIVNRYERLVYAIPLREGLSREEAADVAQETFATLMVSLDRIAQPERLRYWLMTVARRLTWRRRQGRHATAELSPDEGEVEDDLSSDMVTAIWVYDAIQSLGEPCRTLVVSLFFDPAEPSYAEIAVALGRPLGSIGPLRSRCLERLRSMLESG